MTAPGRVNANSGEARRRRDYERYHMGSADTREWVTLEPAPIQPMPKDELMRIALACEAGWRARREKRL